MDKTLLLKYHRGFLHVQRSACVMSQSCHHRAAENAVAHRFGLLLSAVPRLYSVVCKHCLRVLLNVTSQFKSTLTCLSSHVRDNGVIAQSYVVQ